MFGKKDGKETTEMIKKQFHNTYTQKLKNYIFYTLNRSNFINLIRETYKKS